MQKIELEISALTAGHSQGSFSLILTEKNGTRKMPVLIGGFEAQAIAIEIENIKTSRPLTHDLFVTFLKTFDISINEVFIYNLNEGIFFARLVVQKEGKIVEIDSRTSDAIALAVRFNCPIYTTASILDEAGFELDDEDDGVTPGRIVEEEFTPGSRSGSANLDKLNIEELEKQLEEAIREEDYVKAALIRDEIKKRS